MKAAIPTFGARVSPRFDCARAFLLVTLQDGAISEREQLEASDGAPHERINRLLELGVDTIICGGIDCWSAESLESAGVTIYPHVAGAMEDALAALLRGDLESEAATEGAGPRGRRRFRDDDDTVGRSSVSGGAAGRSGGRGRGRGGGRAGGRFGN